MRQETLRSEHERLQKENARLCRQLEEAERQLIEQGELPNQVRYAG